MRVGALLMLAAVVAPGCFLATPAATSELQARSGVLPPWTAGRSGTAPVDVAGGTPPYACALAPGDAMPAGFQLAACNITGTAPLLAPGSSKSLSPPFRVVVTDSAAPPASATATLQIAIEMAAPRLAAAGGTCTVGVACALLLATVESAQPPFTLTAFPHPDGLAFDGGTGVMSGVPTREGVFGVEVCVSDLVGGRGCADVVVTILPAADGDDAEAPEPTPTPGPEPEPVDTTPLALSLSTATCVAKPDASAFEVRSNGAVSGRPGATLVVLVVPVGDAPAIPSAGIAMAADWSLLASTEPYEPLANEAAAPVPQRERGEPPDARWTMSGALAPLGERDVEYRVVARAYASATSEETLVEEATARCDAPRTPARVAVLAATCTLDSRTNIPPGAGGAEIAWTWKVSVAGNFTGPVDERFGLVLSQPYVRMPKSGGTLVADWTAQPTRTIGNGDASWSVHRAATDPKGGSWSVSDLVVTDRDYEVFYADYDTEWGVTAQVGQEVARATFTCPK